MPIRQYLNESLQEGSTIYKDPKRRESANEVLENPQDFAILNPVENENGTFESTGYLASLSVLEKWDDTLYDGLNIRTETPIVAVARGILFQALFDLGLCAGGTHFREWADAREWFFSPNANFDLVMELFKISPEWLREQISRRRCRCGKHLIVRDYCACLAHRRDGEQTYKEAYI